MDTEIIAPHPPTPEVKKLRVKIFGVGTAGGTILEHMARGGFAGAEFAAVNTDFPALTATAGVQKIHLETKLLRGLGTGGDPERGHQVAEENSPRLKEACAGADVIFIVVGLGGGAGTGISPVLARAAREAGALVLAFVTLPFDCEGNRRHQQAHHGLEQLKAAADGVIGLPNQKTFKLIDENTSVLDTFQATTQLLIEGVRGVWRLLMHRGLIEIHFDDLSRLLRDRHSESCFAAVEAAGTTRARDIIEKLPAHPLLDGGSALKEADAVLVSLMGGPDLTMAEINRVMESINCQCERAQVVMGAAVDEAFRDRLAVTVIATRRSHGGTKTVTKTATTETATDSSLPDFETEFMQHPPVARPAARIVPPAPALSQEQREQLFNQQTTSRGRGRKNASRMKQGSLPLDIMNKGRFDKTEPTVHKGEDLDLPTYVRRGVAMN
jgi:cell division protein FtsZ